jgi:cytochrome c
MIQVKSPGAVDHDNLAARVGGARGRHGGRDIGATVDASQCWIRQRPDQGATRMKPILVATATFLAVAFSGNAAAGPGEDLIASNKCSKCHTATTTKKGPSFASLAEKYKGDAGAQAKLVEVLKTGGKDGHDVVKAGDADLKAIVAVVLSSK